MRKYRDIPLEELEKMWNERRMHIRIGTSDMDEVFEMRREIDRRKGNHNPSTDVNYESYLTD